MMTLGGTSLRVTLKFLPTFGHTWRSRGITQQEFRQFMLMVKMQVTVIIPQGKYSSTYPQGSHTKLAMTTTGTITSSKDQLWIFLFFDDKIKPATVTNKLTHEIASSHQNNSYSHGKYKLNQLTTQKRQFTAHQNQLVE